jgi:hypothetical protein
MAYNEELAKRIQLILQEKGIKNLEEKKMFGGIGYLVSGNMACGVHKQNLIVRVGKKQYAHALMQAHTLQFDMTGRPMSGWVMVTPEGCAEDAALRAWVEKGLAFVGTLPPKG